MWYGFWRKCVFECVYVYIHILIYLNYVFVYFDAVLKGLEEKTVLC